MIPKAPANAKELARLLKQGEGRTLGFKRSTGELREGLQTICAFLNGSGGMVLFGVRPDGRPEGQEVSDQTLRDVAQALDRFEPPVTLVVTFRAPIAVPAAPTTALAGGRPESQPESRPESQAESLALRVLASLHLEPLRKAEISSRFGQKEVSGQLNKVIRGLLRQGSSNTPSPTSPTAGCRSTA